VKSQIITASYFKPVAYPIDRGKGEEIPLQAWAGPVRCRRLRLPKFKTFGT
jgi:hypothetical protein